MSSAIDGGSNTPQNEILDIISQLRLTFQSKITLCYKWRIKQLKKLKVLFQDESLKIALYNDLHRSQFESNMLELDLINDEIDYAINNLDAWKRPQPKSTNLANLPGSSYVKYDPLGTCLVMSPWNYPLLLTFQPLIGAIAAGNTVLLRPANYSSNVSFAIFQLIDKYFNNHNDDDGEFYNKFHENLLTKSGTQINPKFRRNLPIYVVLGDRYVTDFVLNQQFDYIFFTGGPHLGKIVLSKAAQYLTPCTIELGGKSPAIVDKNVGDLHVVAKRLVWASFLNSGQTCVRPDYCFIHEDVYAELLPLLKQYICQFYGNYLQWASGQNDSGMNSGDGQILKEHQFSGDEREYHVISVNRCPIIVPPSTTLTETDCLIPPNVGTDEYHRKNKAILPSTAPPQQPTTMTKTSLPSFNSLLDVNISNKAIDFDYGTFEVIEKIDDKNGDKIDDDKIDDGKNIASPETKISSHPFINIANSPYFGRIINETAFERLSKLIKLDKDFIYVGGLVHKSSLFISPTILSFPNLDLFSQSASMQDEIFGPILPCVSYNNINQVINFIRKSPKPLALYCFSNNSTTQDRIQNETSSGSLVFNDAIVQLSNHNLPFGGVGLSGYGKYHGFYSFETFSHAKSTLKKTTWFDIFARYPPYTNVKRNVFTMLHCLEGCSNGLSSINSKIRRFWHAMPTLIQLFVILAILGGLGCAFYWGLLPLIMKLMKLCVEKYYKD
jgi:acyl-CoA reductase-like NAD-dependent aldehyde dehydrogenase